MRRFGFALTAIYALTVSGQALAQETPRVVTVNYALQYMAERLLDGDAEVVFPVPDDVDPSFWRPSIADITAIQSADLIVLNGAGFASWVDRVSLPRSKTVTTAAGLAERFIITETITHSHGDGGEHAHEGLAAYTWLDLTMAAAQAEAMADAITARDLAAPDGVAERLTDLLADFEQLDRDTRTRLANAQGVAMIATHPRYQYLARRYALNINALEWEAGAMPTPAQLDALDTLAAETGAGVIIWEAAPPPEAIAAAAERGLQSAVFPPLAQIAEPRDFVAAFSAGVDAISNAVNMTEDD